MSEKSENKRKKTMLMGAVGSPADNIPDDEVLEFGEDDIVLAEADFEILDDVLLDEDLEGDLDEEPTRVFDADASASLISEGTLDELDLDDAYDEPTRVWDSVDDEPYGDIDDEKTRVRESMHVAPAGRPARSSAPAADAVIEVPRPERAERRSPLLTLLIALLALATIAVLALAIMTMLGRDNSRQDQVVEASAPANGRVVVNTLPAGAVVLIDGVQQAGVTPMTVDGLEDGRTYRVQVQLADHEPIDQAVVASNDAPVMLDRSLVSQIATLEVTSRPPGARVLVDGQERGVTPMTIEGLNRTRAYRVALNLDGYAATERLVHWEAGAPAARSLSLTLVEARDPAALPNSGAADPENGVAADAAEPEATGGVVAAQQRAETNDAPGANTAAAEAQTPPERRAAERAAERERERTEQRRREREERRAREREERRAAEAARAQQQPATNQAPPDSTRRDAATGPASISVQAVPYAQVYVDGRRVAAETPLINHEISAGTHRVKVFFVALQRFSDERWVRLDAGERRTLRFRAEP